MADSKNSKFAYYIGAIYSIGKPDWYYGNEKVKGKKKSQTRQRHKLPCGSLSLNPERATKDKKNFMRDENFSQIITWPEIYIWIKTVLQQDAD